MADQTFAVNSGFYDAVDSDRTYSADDMNKPYKRLVSNGVFATPSGTPSTDLQVVSAGSGMGIIVKAGEGIFADKWFENPAAISITVPNNTNTVPRRDSVIVQVDLRSSGRVGNIVYRTGTPSSNPLPPNIGTVNNVIEYRIANVYVAPSANAINNDAIVDLRGSSECPWITALINQVDTSTLFDQWQAAYEYYYNESTADFTEYMNEKQTEFDQWLENLTQQLSVSTNMIMSTSNYVTTGSNITNVPINITSYNHTTDILQVYINGLRAIEGTHYSLSSDYESINLVTALGSGQTVTFVVFKSIISGDMSTGLTLMQNFDAKLSKYLSDSGWITFILESGATAYDSNNPPQVRCIGNKVYLRGAITGVPIVGYAICTLPVAYRPSAPHIWTSSVCESGNVLATVTMEITTNGTVLILGASTSASSGCLSLDTTFSIDAPAGWATSGTATSGALIAADDGNGNVTLSTITE